MSNYKSIYERYIEITRIKSELDTEQEDLKTRILADMKTDKMQFNNGTFSKVKRVVWKYSSKTEAEISEIKKASKNVIAKLEQQDIAEGEAKKEETETLRFQMATLKQK